MGERTIGRRAARLLLAGLITVVVAPPSAVLLHTDVFHEVADALNDRYFPLPSAESGTDQPPRISIVTLPAEAAGGWTRTQHADMIRAIDAAGALAIGYDVVFDQHGEGGEHDEDDAALAQAIRDVATVTECPINQETCEPRRFPKVALAMATEVVTRPGELPTFRVVFAPQEKFWQTDDETSCGGGRSAELGNVAVFPGTDGVIRHVPLIAKPAPDEDLAQSVSSLSLQVVELYLQRERGLDFGCGRSVTYNTKRGEMWLFDGTKVVADSQFRLEVNWVLQDIRPKLSSSSGECGPNRSHGPVVSHVDVLCGNANLEGQIVFVGVVDVLADFEEIRTGFDTIVTPLDRGGMPGVFVHANAADTILTGRSRSDGTAEATWAIFLGVSLLAFGGMTMSARLRPTVTIFAAGFVTVLGWQWWVERRFLEGVNLNQLWPNLAFILATAGVAGARYITEEREARRVAGLFRQYLPDAVANDLLLSDRLAAAADGERTDVTVLFCDLRGFTATAANLPPADVRAMLEVYYDHSTRVIKEHGGTVMQFVGDEVFAVFGAPIDQPDHAQRALDAAMAMQAAAKDINAELEPRGVSVAFGIGLNSGEVVAAHVGSQIHKQYAVVGQTATVGARLCSRAEPGGVVLSKWTRERLARVPELESLGSVSLKGVSDDPEPAKVLMPE